MSSSSLDDMILKADRVYIVGNGGSYANAVHICNDLLACGVKAYTLDPATLTASANDYGYDTVFSRWIGTVGEPGDLLIALSGSGKSPNILAAVRVAEGLGMMVWKEYGLPQGLDMQSAEERQVWLGHEVMRCLRKN